MIFEILMEIFFICCMIFLAGLGIVIMKDALKKGANSFDRPMGFVGAFMTAFAIIILIGMFEAGVC